MGHHSYFNVLATPSFLYLIALWFHILSKYPIMDNFQHLISQHLYLPDEYCKKKSNSADWAIRDLWFTHSWALHTILQSYYMYLMINTYFSQKLCESCISLTSKFFHSVSQILDLFFISHRKIKTNFLKLSVSYLPTMYVYLLLPVPSSDSFWWRWVSATHWC